MDDCDVSKILAATVSNDGEAEEFRRFLDAHKIRDEDRVIRRIALRGFAMEGVALARAEDADWAPRQVGSLIAASVSNQAARN